MLFQKQSMTKHLMSFAEPILVQEWYYFEMIAYTTPTNHKLLVFWTRDHLDYQSRELLLT